MLHPTPTTRPPSVSRRTTRWPVRIEPPSRTTIVARRAMSDWPPLRVRRPGAPDAVELDGRPDQLGDRRQQLVALEVGRLDRAAERHPAGRVVVLGERQPLEVDRRVGLELGDQLGGVGEEGVDLARVGVDQDRLEVGPGALGGVRDAGALLHLAPGQPARAARVRRRAPDERRPLQDGDLQARLGRQGRAGQGAAPGADHDDVVLLLVAHARILEHVLGAVVQPSLVRPSTSPDLEATPSFLGRGTSITVRSGRRPH